MPIPGLDAARCARRNALAARKGINSIPLALSAKPPGPIDTADPATMKGLRVLTAKGKLPRDKAGAMERINAMLGADTEPLTEDQVHVVYMEAGNSNYIPSRQFHLGDSTLRNIAARASKSIAFMNSHRFGGLSTDAELPYGRSFSGRFEQAITEDGRLFSRVILGVYMLAGVKPNGDSGPSTDDLYLGIKGGTIFDVSLCAVGGDAMCDVCGTDLALYDLESGEPVCPHVPGTHHKMSDGEIKTQLAKGVTQGVASFTLENATASEVSSVFDGALPGAGFRRALAASHRNQLSESSLAEARAAYKPLASRRDFDLSRARLDAPVRTTSDDLPTPTRGASMDLKNVPVADAYRFWKAMGEPENVNLADLQASLSGGGNAPPRTPPADDPAPPKDEPPAAPLASANPSSNPEVEVLREQVRQLTETVTTEREDRKKESNTTRLQAFRANAENWADSQVRLGVAIPAERDELVSLYTQAAQDDHQLAASVSYRDKEGMPKVGTRVEALTALWSKRSPHHHGREFVSGRDQEFAAAAPGNPAITNGAPAPLVSLSPLSASHSADPLGDQMAAEAVKFAERRNGHRASK